MGARLNAHKRGSSHGLGAADEDNWRHQGACTQYPADWWTPTGTETLDAQWATWVCRQCPVRQRCDDWAQKNTELCTAAIYAGTYYTVGKSTRQPLARQPGTQPTPRGLNGRIDELRELAATPLGLREIADRLGGYTQEGVRQALQRNGIERAS